MGAAARAAAALRAAWAGLRWFATPRYVHLRRRAPELDAPSASRDAAALKARFLRLMRKGDRAGDVRFLLTVAASLTSLATLAELATQETVEALGEALEDAEPGDLGVEAAAPPRVAGLTDAESLGAITAAFAVARTLVARYIRLLAGAATMTAIQLATAPGAPAAEPGPSPAGSRRRTP